MKPKRFKKAIISNNILATFKILVEEVFSPLFNQEEIPEIIFNPVNARLKDDRITEYVSNLPDEEIKRIVLKGFKAIADTSINEKIMLFFGLFAENNSMDLEEFDASKIRIFGEEVEGLSLEDEYFKGLFTKKREKIRDIFRTPQYF